MWGPRSKPNIFKLIFGLFGFLVFLVFLEFCWFYVGLQSMPGNEKADAIVVFGGSHDRTVKGYTLANEGLVPFFIISPSSEKRITYLNRIYRLKDSYQYLIEDRAETTFQNAVLAADLIQKHELKSVVLVTSDYHMPRSLFLFKLRLIGRGVEVEASPVTVDRFRDNPLSWSGMQKKRVYNEMVELVGSLLEMGHYTITGKLPQKGVKRNKVISWLRSVLLFEIGHS